jgi:hypothetical protein
MTGIRADGLTTLIIDQNQHLIGWAIETGRVRQSSPIIRVNSRGEVITRSGRAYSLVGPPGGSIIVNAVVQKIFHGSLDKSDEFLHLAKFRQ